MCVLYLIMPPRRATPRNTRSYRGLVGGLVSPPKMPAPAVARDALAMATPVTDSVSPYRALKRQPTASLFFQGIVCSRANRDRSITSAVSPQHTRPGEV